MSGEQDRDYLQEIEGQMQAAEALIESLEEEVNSLRGDLEQASLALKAAHEEVAAREDALEQSQRARSAAEKRANDASSAVTELRMLSSDEQLELTNRHIAELARLHDSFQDQLRNEIESAISTEDLEALQEEHRKVQTAAQKRYEERITDLENSYAEAQERLRRAEEEFEDRRATEIEALRKEADDQKRELERKLLGKQDQAVQEALRSAAREHEENLAARRESFANREAELKQEHQTELQKQRAELEAQQAELQTHINEQEDQHQVKLREIKGLAENREKELRKTHSSRLAEAKAEFERRIESLQAQRQADNKALRNRAEQDLAELRRQFEERMRETVENSREELWTTQEKLEGLKLKKSAESAAYRNRLGELEGALQSVAVDSNGANHARTHEVPVTEADSDDETVPAKTAQQLQAQVEELSTALSVSELARDTLAGELEALRDRGPDDTSELIRDSHQPEQSLDEPSAGSLAEDDESDTRVRDLEARLQETQEESRRNAEELQRARDNLRRLSNPEHLIRAGISAFNESEHSRNVASISKSLGLPKVHAALDETVGKPVFTVVWEELAWRRYVAEPAEDVEEPHVYLIESADEPDESEATEQIKPNARIDAQGRIILGVQAR